VRLDLTRPRDRSGVHRAPDAVGGAVRSWPDRRATCLCERARMSLEGTG
jgi:hypothetical protein